MGGEGSMNQMYGQGQMYPGGSGPNGQGLYSNGSSMGDGSGHGGGHSDDDYEDDYEDDDDDSDDCNGPDDGSDDSGEEDDEENDSDAASAREDGNYQSQSLNYSKKIILAINRIKLSLKRTISAYTVFKIIN